MSLSIVTPLRASSDFRVRNFSVVYAEMAPLVANHALEWIIVESGGNHADREHVTRIQLDRPFSKAAANNVGWTAASGDVICFLDADMIMHPDHWEAAIEEAHKHPLYSPYRRGVYLEPDMTRVRVRDDFSFDWADKVTKPTAKLIFEGGIVFIHRWILTKIYGWDERFSAECGVAWGGEDNCVMRLAKNEADPVCGSGIGYHLYHDGSHRKKNPAKRLLRKHYPKGKWASVILDEKLEFLKQVGSPVVDAVATGAIEAPAASVTRSVGQPAAAVLAAEPAYEGETLPIPAVHPGSSDNWFVAVTTAPRQECTLQQCIDSLRSAGWEPTVFAEPGSTPVDAETIENEAKKGAWHNWLQSVRYAIENTDAQLILTVQDDVVLHPESRLFIESVLWPSEDAGFVSLYIPKHYSFRGNTGKLRPPGIHSIATDSLVGACTLAWPRDVLEEAIDHPVARSWLGAARKSRRKKIHAAHRKDPTLIANIDTAIGKVMNAMERRMYFVDPSLAQHIARFSTLGHGSNTTNKGRRNCFRFADHSRPIGPQVFPKTSEAPAVDVQSPRLKIVTSFSPSRIERQQYCLSTWQKYGFPIVAVQSPGEIDQIEPHFSGVEFAVDERVGTDFGRENNVRIKALVEQAADCPILLVNSDVSIKNDSRTFRRDWIDIADGTCKVGIRWDWRGPHKKQLYPSGIDAFRITPEQASALPDHGFAIGCPVWDYWLVWQMHCQGWRIATKQDLGLIHTEHPCHWNNDDLMTGWRLFAEHDDAPLSEVNRVIQTTTGRIPRMTSTARIEAKGDGSRIKVAQRIGLVGFNTAQGLGYVNRDIAKHLPLDRWLITEHRSHPLLPPIEGVNSRTVPPKLSDSEIRRQLQGLDVVLFVETIAENMPRVARSMGIKTVCIPMVEWLPMDKDWTHHVDLWLAATQFSFNQLLALRVKGRVLYCPWPIDTRGFEFQQRTKCKRYVFAHGNGGPRDRKGGKAVAAAAKLAPDIPLIIYSQVQNGFRSSTTEDVTWPDSVDFRGAVDSPAALYREGDVFLLPSRWEGLGLQLFESQAAGMPLITTDAPPMNEARPWKRMPCTPTKVRLSHDYVSFDVSPKTIAETMRECLGADITEASRSARDWVVANRDWTSQTNSILKCILEG